MKLTYIYSTTVNYLSTDLMNIVIDPLDYNGFFKIYKYTHGTADRVYISDAAY